VPVIAAGNIIPDNNIASVLTPDELLASSDTSIKTFLAIDLLVIILHYNTRKGWRWSSTLILLT